MPNFSSNTIQAHVVRFNSKLNKFEHLLLRRSDEARVYPSTWQVVTGRIESGETSFHAALRELLEETSLVPLRAWSVPYVASFYMFSKDDIGFAPVFGFLVGEHAEVTISFEHSEYKWVDLEQFKSLIPMPSQIEGAYAFNEFVLKSNDDCIFEIGKELWIE